MGDTELPRYTGFRGLSVRGITALQCTTVLNIFHGTKGERAIEGLLYLISSVCKNTYMVFGMFLEIQYSNLYGASIPLKSICLKL